MTEVLETSYMVKWFQFCCIYIGPFHDVLDLHHCSIMLSIGEIKNFIIRHHLMSTIIHNLLDNPTQLETLLKNSKSLVCELELPSFKMRVETL